MSRILFVIFLLFGQLYGRSQQPPAWQKQVPATFIYKQELDRIVFLPGGKTTIGYAWGSDSLSDRQPQEISHASFCLWKYETSNLEYRAFVYWVLDSVCRELLGHYQMVNGQKLLNREKTIDPTHEQLSSLWKENIIQLPGRKFFDMQKIFYALPNGDSLAVAPDSTVWVRDVPFRYNDIGRNRYFIHPALNNYPVVGISYAQAMAYCAWKTKMWNEALVKAGDTLHRFLFRLPTAQEWEVAATNRPAVKTGRGWAYHFPLQAKEDGPYLYNFGEVADANGFVVKHFNEHSSFYIMACNSYNASEKGLYNMCGNAAEWTASRGNTARTGKYMIVKGGSWAQNPYYLQPAVNDYVEPGMQKASLGFRVVVEFGETRSAYVVDY